MEEIKVGEYVRTRNNGIKRIDTIFENKTINRYGYECGSDWDGKWYSYVKTTDIVKHSENIIDLIEVNDIVKVLDIDWIRILKRDNEEEIEMFKEELEENNYKLLSIVTHEQFEQVEYKI